MTTLDLTTLSVSSLVGLLSQNTELASTTKQFSRFLLVLAHCQLSKELEKEIESDVYVANPAENDKWRAMCYDRAQQLTETFERLSFTARLHLFIEFNGQAMFSHLGYGTLSEWIAEQGEKYQGRSGAYYDFRFIANALVPFCETHSIFESPAALADFLLGSANLNRVRGVISSLRQCIEQDDPAGVKFLLLDVAQNKDIPNKALPLINALGVEGVKDLLAQDIGPAGFTEALQQAISQHGNKPLVTITPNGVGFHLHGVLSTDQVESFVARNRFAMLIEKTES